MASRALIPHAAPLDLLLASVPSLPRPILARLTSRMIERLDEMDGDADLEDDDPAGGSADDVGEVEEWEREGAVMARPAYGLDQSTGPINVQAANNRFNEDWLDAVGR